MRTHRSTVALLCAAVGATLGAPALAQPLETNLVANPGFEAVDVNFPGPFTSLFIFDWQDNDADGDDVFAFPYTSQYSGSPQPPDSGAYHYSGGFNTAADQILVFQTVDVASGPAGKLVQSGNGFFDLSAYFSGYRLQDDACFVRVFFLDESGNDITPADQRVGGTTFLLGLPVTDVPGVGLQRDWGRDRLGGPIPAATRSVLVAIGSSDADENHDGYVDNVDFRVTATNPAPASFAIVSPVNGQFFEGTAFTADWADAFNAASYTVTVSASPDLSNPIFNQSGVTSSEFSFTNQIGNGVWYIDVTAVNSGGSTESSNGPIRFAVVAGGGSGCRADFNGDGIANSQDFFDFLTAFFAGC
jgi:hypothetical protein